MYLQQIVKDKKRRLLEEMKLAHLNQLRSTAAAMPPPLDLASALKGNGISLIAEVKKASPSRGVIKEDFNPLETALAYADSGASAISVLTEQDSFQGELSHLEEIKKKLPSNIPVLRKDFIFDTYQIYQSRAVSADALLLIVAILSPQQLSEFLELSHQLGMSCLVEVHNKNELATALECGARIIGINNRNLSSFRTDLSVTERLRPHVPDGLTVVSESGVKNRTDIEKLKELKVDAVLIGEALMTAPNIGNKIKELF